MDLGCIDMGCVEKPSKETSLEREDGAKETSASKLGKINKAKDAVRSSFGMLNKLTSQISKPPHRGKTLSPINWFPRKKVEPYLKRKIKMLQQVDGMHSTLDETLGDSNPHYCRVLREKIAIREAAEKAMEARKAAMVEASWCRILQAARIGSKEAEDRLLKAELAATEAFEAARVVGVIMNDIPDSVETPAKGESTMHTVSATFEPAFEVDRQVATAVKAAFIKLASCPPIDEDFKELLHRISENPDNNLSDVTSERESDGVESEGEEGDDGQRKCKKRRESDNFSQANMVDMMLGRLRCLKEGELASLATIVATSGLNAALAKMENGVQRGLSSSVEAAQNQVGINKVATTTKASLGRRTSLATAREANGVTNGDLPSLDKFLVKRLTRLEREVLEAKNARKNESEKVATPSACVESSRSDDSSTIPDLASTLVKRPSRLEREVQEAKNARKIESQKVAAAASASIESSRSDGVPDLASTLVKRPSRLEKAVEEARMNSDRQLPTKRRGKKEDEEPDVPSLDKVLVKRLTRLEREVQEARRQQKFESTGKKTDDDPSEQGKENKDLNRIKNTNNHSESDSLDKVLVKHVSRLEKEKQEFLLAQPRINPKRKQTASSTTGAMEGSLDQVLVKHKSRLEREKMWSASKEDNDNNTGMVHSVSRRQAREKELQAAWGGLSLGNSIRPHVSRLQREKAAWVEAEEEERKRTVEEEAATTQA